MGFQKKDQSAFATVFWGGLPFLVILGLVFLSLIPGQLPFKAVSAPFPLLAIFFWAVFRPNALSIGVIFAIGLLVDLLGGTPIGAHAFLYVLIFSLSKTQRRFLSGQGFMLLWFSFLLACLMHQGLLWGGHYLITRGDGLPPLSPLLIGGGIVAALLPVVFPLLTALNARLDRAEEEAL